MTRWELFKAALPTGDYGAWRRTCEKARDEGWSLAGVSLMVDLASPIMWIVAASVVYMGLHFCGVVE